VRKTYPHFRQAVYVRRQRTGGATALPWKSIIKVTASYNRNWVLMHELAHIVTYEECRRLDVPLASHGRDWARGDLGLVREGVSEQAYRDLRASFTKHRVVARGTDAFHYARVERRKAAKRGIR
jgi:predicted SprT family Zn-dependent metalloprotease